MTISRLFDWADTIIPDDSPSPVYASKFKQALTEEIKTLNNLIDVYNEASDELKIAALGQLKQALNTMQHRFPNDLKQYYHSIYHKQIVAPLFDVIRQEEIGLGILNPSQIKTLPEFIANLPQESLDQLLALLLEKDFTQERLKQASFLTDETLQQSFQVILDRYEIEVLGGHNSKNFKCKDKFTGKIEVMKVENRMNMPKEAANELREKALSSVFTPERHEREGFYLGVKPDGKQAMLSRSILFTEYYPKGDLKRTVNEEVGAKLDSALDKYLQMGHILQDIEQAGYCFPDMKNANWLVDDFGQLRIADTKSFLYTQKEEGVVEDFLGNETIEQKRILNRTNEKNSLYSLPNSPHMNPPELIKVLPRDSHDSVDMRRVHAYMLGKNLYQCLTGCSDILFIKRDKNGEIVLNQDGQLVPVADLSGLPFDHEIFLTEEGRALKTIIKDALLEDPAQRTQLNDMVQNLAFVQYPDLSRGKSELIDLKINAYQALKQLESFKIGSHDEIMLAYLNQQKEAIKNADTKERVDGIVAEINAMLFVFKHSASQNKIMTDMTHHLQMSTTPSLVNKGQALEQALLNVPLIERCSILGGKTASQQHVLKVIESIQAPRFYEKKTANSSEEVAKFNVLKGQYNDIKSGQKLETQEPLKPSM